MLNLIKNPNVTSSHLFRADIYYDSENDTSKRRDGAADDVRCKHLKSEYRPVMSDMPGFERTRTIVRELIPRNPQLDKSLLQTCHTFYKSSENEEQTVVMYIPHVQSEAEMPFYHPSVSRLAFIHTWHANVPNASTNTPGTISISYALFLNTTLTTKLQRTALRLLETVHKHGQGQLAGYEKRVHLDQIIPQKRYQDTYTRLKTKYGKLLSEKWVEVTDPGKHVFEDIGIAAYLIELWVEMYWSGGEGRADSPKASFPGFVDIGCGNGVLVYILVSEGCQGWGFDARVRKTWSIFPKDVQSKLERRLLVPEILQCTTAPTEADAIWHDGTFNPGTFIISNHADELTAWTPLLAHLNRSAFIAIPCCSHDLTGARFRAPATTKAVTQGPARLPQQEFDGSAGNNTNGTKAQAAETGSFRRTEAQKKMPSAYSTLCSYVTSLAEENGFEPEKDVLRIPSTRNQCIVGRQRRASTETDFDTRKQAVVEIIEREVGKGIETVQREWIERAEKLAKKPGSGH